MDFLLVTISHWRTDIIHHLNRATQCVIGGRLPVAQDPYFGQAPVSHCSVETTIQDLFW